MEEPIEFDNVSKILIKNFPDIIEDALFLYDEETLEYMVSSDFARYIKKKFDEDNMEKVKKCLEFIELLLINGTQETRVLAIVGYLEDLQNVTGGSQTMDKYEIIYDYLGIELKKWWDKLNEFWDGKVDALNELYAPQNVA
jgi:hypothetical protein